MTEDDVVDYLSDDDLLPCPFCGGPADVVKHPTLLPIGGRDWLYSVRCRMRECACRTNEWYPRAAAVDAWNRRTP